jgi:hypothetical protein
MPRMLTAIVMLLALTLSGFTAPLVAAQEATPAAGKDRLLTDTMGLPELAITATADAYEGVPAETAAGRYVVTLTSTGGLMRVLAWSSGCSRRACPSPTSRR